jgi:hypothetical protein
MGYLFRQVWLWCLLSFALGSLLTWLVMRATRRPVVEVTEERFTGTDRPGTTGRTDRNMTDRSMTDRGMNNEMLAGAAGAAGGVAASRTRSADDLANTIGNKARDSRDSAANISASAADKARGMANSVGDKATGLGAGAAGVAGAAGAAMGSAASKARDTTNSTTESARGMTNGVTDKTRDMASGASDRARGMAGNAKDAANSAMGTGMTGTGVTGAAAAGSAAAASAAAARGGNVGNRSMPEKSFTSGTNAGPFPGSVRSKADGSAPSGEYVIKGNANSMLYHTPDSPSYRETKAELWFRSEAEAQAAGFRAVSKGPRDKRQ